MFCFSYFLIIPRCIVRSIVAFGSPPILHSAPSRQGLRHATVHMFLFLSFLFDSYLFFWGGGLASLFFVFVLLSYLFYFSTSFPIPSSKFFFFLSKNKLKIIHSLRRISGSNSFVTLWTILHQNCDQHQNQTKYQLPFLFCLCLDTMPASFLQYGVLRTPYAILQEEECDRHQMRPNRPFSSIPSTRPVSRTRVGDNEENEGKHDPTAFRWASWIGLDVRLQEALASTKLLHRAHVNCQPEITTNTVPSPAGAIAANAGTNKDNLFHQRLCL